MSTSAPARHLRANAFRRLHQTAQVLALPSAWDVGSAVVFARSGFPAIETTTAGIAMAHGYADGEEMPFAEMAAVVAAIVHAADLPVSADIEAGFARSTDELVGRVLQLVEAGVAGITLDDAAGAYGRRRLLHVDDQVQRLQAVRLATVRAGVPIVINARTDVYMIGSPNDVLRRRREAICRGNAYGHAGADCVFVPGVADLNDIRTLVTWLHAPLNVLAGTGVPPVAALAGLGVARVSMGSGGARAALSLAERVGRELHDHGTYTEFTDPMVMSHGDLWQMFGNRDGETAVPLAIAR